MRPQHKAAKVLPYNRLDSFDSHDAMERHDAALAEIMAAHDEPRHRSEVRRLLYLRNGCENWDSIQSYLVTVKRKRGEIAHDRLASDIKSQWRAGNRGNPNDWR